MSFNKGKILFLILVILVIFTRFYRLNWDNGFSFHPDENNMAVSVSKMSFSRLNPNFFAYGQFPLYLTFFTTPKLNLPTITLTFRFWSAIFSSFSIVVFYFIGQKIFSSSKLSFIFCLLLVFTPGLIQSSHFGTTESILIFIFSLNIFLSFLIYDHPQKNIYLFLSGIISGIGLATKISAAIFITPICLSFLFIFLKNPKKIFSLILKFLILITTTLFFSVLLSPYNLIDSSKFLSSMGYEIGVANGSIPIFYTRQFIGSLPYLFQFQKIFPYVNGISVFIFSFIGLGFIIKTFFKRQKNVYLLITLFSGLIYFLYQGQLFAKWTRFMSPIFFCGPLLRLFLFKKLKNKFLEFIFIILAIIPGIYFFINTYFFPDIRVQATNWINQNIPAQSQVLSEGGNVVDIPINNSNNLNINNFDFYTLDDEFSSFQKLNSIIKESEYIFIPSRRVFKNQNNPSFPLSQKYYQSLFSGKLGFSLVKTFSKSNSLFLNAENAEETWSVFDNPVVRIFSSNENYH